MVIYYAYAKDSRYLKSDEKREFLLLDFLPGVWLEGAVGQKIYYTVSHLGGSVRIHWEKQHLHWLSEGQTPLWKSPWQDKHCGVFAPRLGRVEEQTLWKKVLVWCRGTDVEKWYGQWGRAKLSRPHKATRTFTMYSEMVCLLGTQIPVLPAWSNTLSTLTSIVWQNVLAVIMCDYQWRSWTEWMDLGEGTQGSRRQGKMWGLKAQRNSLWFLKDREILFRF